MFDPVCVDVCVIMCVTVFDPVCAAVCAVQREGETYTNTFPVHYTTAVQINLSRMH